jgi:hypothetical protein
MRCALLLLVACSSSTSTPPSNTAKGSDTAAPKSTGALPEVMTSCTTDAECGHVYIYLVDGKCCDGTCSPTLGNSAYALAVSETCRRIGRADEGSCPVKKCAAPPPFACVSGQCREK